jgi:hypothetical protein
MKGKIKQSRLHTLAYKYLISRFGELKSEKDYPDTINWNIPHNKGKKEKLCLEIFVKNGEDTVVMNYDSKRNGFYFRISDDIYQDTQSMFSLDHNEIRKILDEFVFNLTGYEIVMVETF